MFVFVALWRIGVCGEQRAAAGGGRPECVGGPVRHARAAAAGDGREPPPRARHPQQHQHGQARARPQPPHQTQVSTVLYSIWGAGGF